MDKRIKDTQGKSVKADTRGRQEDDIVLSELSDREVSPESLPLATPQPRYDLQILQSLRQIIRAVDLHSQKLKVNFNITAPQLVCLLAIHNTGSLTATQIARSVHLSPSTVVGILDRLERSEFIRRTRDVDDRRQVNITLTSKGKKLANNAPSPLQDSLAEALRQLPEIEQTTIALSLKRIADLMEVRRVGAPLILETTQPVNRSKGESALLTQGELAD